jgi:uncharacterized OB-fold protein
MLIIALWVAGVVAYIIYLRQELNRRRKEEKTEDEKRKRHRGKKCPQCQNVISAKREFCQHCGYKFSEIEIKAETERESDHYHHHGSGSHRKRKRGKKCPQCQNVINYTREVCQHCGYKFNMAPENKAKTEDVSDNP